MAPMEIDDHALEVARVRGEHDYACPRAVSACFDVNRSRVIVTLETGESLSFDARALRGLHEAIPADLSDVIVDGAGYTLSFPRIDADFGLPYLIERFGAESETHGATAET